MKKLKTTLIENIILGLLFIGVMSGGRPAQIASFLLYGRIAWCLLLLTSEVFNVGAKQ